MLGNESEDQATVTPTCLASHTAQGGPAAPRPAPSPVLSTGSENGSGEPWCWGSSWRNPDPRIISIPLFSFPRLWRSLLYLYQPLLGSPSCYLTTILPAECSTLPPEVSLTTYNDPVSSLLSIIHPHSLGSPSPPTHAESFLGKDMSHVLHPQSLPYSRLTWLKKEWTNISIGPNLFSCSYLPKSSFSSPLAPLKGPGVNLTHTLLHMPMIPTHLQHHLSSIPSLPNPRAHSGFTLSRGQKYCSSQGTHPCLDQGFTRSRH